MLARTDENSKQKYTHCFIFITFNIYMQMEKGLFIWSIISRNCTQNVKQKLGGFCTRRGRFPETRFEVVEWWRLVSKVTITSRPRSDVVPWEPITVREVMDGPIRGFHQVTHRGQFQITTPTSPRIYKILILHYNETRSWWLDDY